MILNGKAVIVSLVLLAFQAAIPQEPLPKSENIGKTALEAIRSGNIIGYSEFAESQLYGVTQTLQSQEVTDGSWAATQLMLWKRFESLELGWWQQKESTVRVVILVWAIDSVPTDQKEKKISYFIRCSNRFEKIEKKSRLNELEIAMTIIKEKKFEEVRRNVRASGNQ